MLYVQSLILRGHIFGLDSVEVFRACKSVGEMCNYLSMSMLQQDLFDVALELLKKAEVLTERHKAVRAVTFNNLACQLLHIALCRSLVRVSIWKLLVCPIFAHACAICLVLPGYYRKRGKLRTALNYARKALGIEAKISESVKSADTVR